MQNQRACCHSSSGIQPGLFAWFPQQPESACCLSVQWPQRLTFSFLTLSDAVLQGWRLIALTFTLLFWAAAGQLQLRWLSVPLTLRFALLLQCQWTQQRPTL